MKIKLSLISIILLCTLVSQAQYKNVEFGQNRVQYKNFDWFYYSTDNYNVHFYNLGEEYAKVALDVLDEEYEEITDLIGYSPFAKTKLFIYNSPTDLLQSNIGVGAPVFSIAGETKFVKLQLEVAYPGSVIAFRKELKYKFAQMLLNDMMFGGSLADVFQSSYLLHLPEWFTEGAANYVAYGWNIEMDDYIRDYLTKKRIKKFSRLEGEQAVLVGQSVWNYIAVRYGQSNLSNILNLTRIIRNEEHSIASSLGLSYEQFMYEWADYYGVPIDAIDLSYIGPEKEDRIVRTLKGDAELTKLKISPDGSKIAYVQNFIGKYKVIIKDIESGKERIAHKGGYHIIDQEVSYLLPLIDWVSDTKLGIVEASYGTNNLVIYDLAQRTKTKKSLVRFNQINDISFNDNGKLAVLSADVKGQTDLYLISMRRNAVKRLTKDPWDDLYPQFIPGTNAIVFSSNRTSDSLGFKPSKVSETPDMLNLFAYDLDTTSNMLYRLTNTLSNDIRPVAFNKDNVYYLSDLKGINNMYKYSFSDSLFTQVTNFRTSLKAYDINQYTKDLSFLMLNQGKSKIYLNEEYDLDRTVFTPPTIRHQVKQIEYIRALRESKSAEELKDSDEKINSTEQNDAIKTENEINEYQHAVEYEFLVEDYKNLVDTTSKKPSEFIDLDNYQFGDESSENIEVQDSPIIRPNGAIDSLSTRIRLEQSDTLLSNVTTVNEIDTLIITSNLPLVDEDSITNQTNATQKIPPIEGTTNNDKEDAIGELSKKSEFIDIENYQFGSIVNTEQNNSTSNPYQKVDEFSPSENSGFEIDTTLIKTPKSDFVDTDDYRFEDEKESEENVFSFLSIYLKIQKEPTVIGPLPFETFFTVDKVVTSAVFDQLRGFGFLMETQMSDVLENHRFNGGFMAITDFKSGDFFAEYSFLKYTIDLHARYDRRVVFKEGNEIVEGTKYNDYSQKYKMNTYTVGASLPLSASSRFEIDGFTTTTNFTNLNPVVLSTIARQMSFGDDPVKVESKNSYIGVKGSWIFDNTLSSGLNLFEGAKGKVSFEHFQSLNDNLKSFSNFNIDLRRYQKLHRELIFATRIYYGRSIGNQPKTYMLGGMDNWLFSRSDNQDQPETPLSFSNFKDNSAVLFSEFVNLRGFDFNRFSGNNVLALNAELRWPIIKYFTRGAIKSDFLRNLQFIGFYDIGSAWTGVSPFNEDNTVDTKIVKRLGASPFEATIKTNRNPWLASYGYGIRTVLLGYYARFDVAWPIEDYEVGDTRFYLTIGYDF